MKISRNRKARLEIDPFGKPIETDIIVKITSDYRLIKPWTNESGENSVDCKMIARTKRISAANVKVRNRVLPERALIS